MAIPHHSPTTTASVDKFLAARKDFLEWRAAKQKALQLAEKRFPDNKSLRRCVASLCCGNLLSEWTLAADNAACALADRVGDEPFVPGALEAGPTTLGLYRFDVGTGNWAYPELWSRLPAMTLQGVVYDATGTPAAGPCF